MGVSISHKVPSPITTKVTGWVGLRSITISDNNLTRQCLDPPLYKNFVSHSPDLDMLNHCDGV